MKQFNHGALLTPVGLKVSLKLKFTSNSQVNNSFMIFAKSSQLTPFWGIFSRLVLLTRSLPEGFSIDFLSNETFREFYADIIISIFVKRTTVAFWFIYLFPGCMRRQKNPRSCAEWWIYNSWKLMHCFCCFISYLLHLPPPPPPHSLPAYYLAKVGNNTSIEMRSLKDAWLFFYACV